MNIFGLLGIVAACGAVGGVIATLTSEDRGFPLPGTVENTGGKVWRPGWIGLIIIGAVAAAVSFALYGPLTGQTVIGGPDNPNAGAADDYGLTLAALGGAVLVGAGGSKWFASQVDKRILRDAAVAAAAGDANAHKAGQIGSALPTVAFRLANNIAPSPSGDVETRTTGATPPTSGSRA